MKIRLSVISLTMLLMLSAKSSFADDVVVSPDKGKTIFTTRCTSCHNVNAQLVGPALANVEERRPVEWIISFVNSPQAMISKKDKDAVALYNKFNQVTMPDHTDLSSDDIKNVLAYIKSETKTATVETAPFAKPGMPAPNYYPLTFTGNYGFFISYLVSVLVLVLVLVFAVNVKDMQRNAS